MRASTATTPHVDAEIRALRQTWGIAYLAMVGAAFVIAVLARRRVTEPFLGVSLAVLALIVLGWMIRPRITLYVTIFLTAVSDIVTISWFPFVKNLSSRESISFLADAATVSPLDLSLFVGFTVSALRQYADTGRLLAPGRLNRAITVFTAFVAFGFARGVVLGGGDLRIAVLEGRALFYLLLVYGIVVNVCTEDSHFRHAMWWLLGGIVVQVLLSIEFLGTLEPSTRDTLESLNEHGSALGHNLLLLTLFAIALFKVKAPLARIGLTVAFVPTMYVYLVAQRRSAVAAFGIAVILLLVVLRWRRPPLFWILAPIVAVVTVGYLGAFWNSQSSAGFPAQAVKSVIAPESASAEDQSSDLYRLIESYDLVFTIRTDPLMGLGFGRPFYRPIPLPALENFELSAYLPHNSILWLWIKVGFGGFVAMFYVIGVALFSGAERLRRMPSGIDLVVTLSATLFVLMYTVYSYVDISWDNRNMVFLGLTCAICARSFPSATDSTAVAPESESVSASRQVVGASN